MDPTRDTAPRPPYKLALRARHVTPSKLSSWIRPCEDKLPKIRCVSELQYELISSQLDNWNNTAQFSNGVSIKAGSERAIVAGPQCQNALLTVEECRQSSYLSSPHGNCCCCGFCKLQLPPSVCLPVLPVRPNTAIPNNSDFRVIQQTVHTAPHCLPALYPSVLIYSFTIYKPDVCPVTHCQGL